MIFTACAVLNKHYMDKGRTQKGNIGMGWTLDENDRSFQFGRLIAAMEKVEQDYYYQSGENGGDKKTRMTTAIKALNSPYQNTLLDLYAKTGSPEAVKEKESELRETVARAGISVAAPSAPEQETMNRAEGETLLALKVSPWQLAKVKDFLTALGIEFEVR